MTIYLMRHGETEYNVLRRFQGRSDIPLNENGIRQAEEAAAAMQDLPIDRIYTSPLVRAVKTAEIVAAYHDLPVIQDDRLIEMSFGPYEGAQREEHPEIEIIFADPAHYVAPPGAESYEDMDIRAGIILDELIRPLEQECGCVLLCCHGALIKAVVRRLLHRSVSDFWIDPPQRNCSCTILDCTGGIITLVEQGRCFH